MNRDEPDMPSPWTAPRVSEEAAPLEPQPTASPPAPSLRLASWRGAKAGVRCVSYVVGPFAAIFLVLGLALMAAGLGAGPGVSIPGMVPRAIGVYLSGAAMGGIAGALIGATVALITKPLQRRLPAKWQRAASRPIRLFRARNRAVLPQDAARRRRRRWIWLGIAVAPIAIVLVVAFGTGVYLRGIVDRRLADAIAQAKRDDPHWQIDDLIAHREPVPDEENSALVVAEVLALLPENWPQLPQPAGAPKPPQTEAEILLERLGEAGSNVRLDGAVADMLREELARDDEAVKIARTLADYDRGWHELVVGPKLYDTPLPETQAARNVARLLSLDAARRAHEGDVDGALDSCRAILAVGRSIGDEPFLISHLVRIAVGTVAVRSARGALAQGEASDPALDRLQSLLLNEVAQPRMVQSLRGERAIQAELIRRVGDGELPIKALGDAQFPLDAEGSRGRISALVKLWFDNSRAIGLERMNEAITIAQLRAADWPPLLKRWQSEVDRLRHSRVGVFTAMLPLSLMPAVTASFGGESRYQADLSATAILVATERHRRKTGDWPNAISAIDPDILRNPPVDPWSGEAFRMDRRDGRLVIYSIGANGQDDHGVFDKKRWSNGGPDDIAAEAWDVPLRAQKRP